MPPLQRVTGQAAGPHSAGSSAGMLANRNITQNQASCFNYTTRKSVQINYVYGKTKIITLRPHSLRLC